MKNDHNTKALYIICTELFPSCQYNRRSSKRRNYFKEPLIKSLHDTLSHGFSSVRSDGCLHESNRRISYNI